MLHPKYIRYIKQALLFACVWLLFGFVYGILEKGILGRMDYYPSTQNRYDFMTSLAFASFGGFVMGFLHGWVEVSWLGKKFTKSPLWVKVVLKVHFYLVFIVLFLVLLTFGVNSNRFEEHLLSKTVLHSVEMFINSFAFWSVVVYIAFGLIMAMLFSELSSYLGGNVFLNFLFGKYHTPKREGRIFMFLDMKSSTTIAEELGHSKYFELLKSCYADMSSPILETSGEIYQYVGDEVVVTWPEKLGLYNNNCIACFYKISEALEKKRNRYKKEFNFFPTFKAGYHIGLVTTGEIGVLKKEIIYTGDVLNTASRIQAECNAYGTQILISDALADQLQRQEQSYRFVPMDYLKLRGKKEQIQLVTIKLDEGNQPKISSI
ncbi:adenylate/guanylate cyclase domain-containing protein [Flagellimonas alvinocaridis]|uniref:Adenylate/guanylate cyclase domain-containing protein n=1 Tax=Flagellimonas alvinocaridis TaxID=2530200 RepID=A0A4S8RP01_9FLAO|nr:adenylate/guanylate cyclase domain-containing protein [Allomuricauda alvinocaridis]THV59572.1 adenylate/guanylate cyclase domain-containing protein [Allomuricauda alvinocaridis]